MAFRGTDGLPFNLLRVNRTIPIGRLNPRSIIRGVFHVETSRDEHGISTYSIDENWRNTSMAYAHALRDKSNYIVIVTINEAVTVTETNRNF